MCYFCHTLGNNLHAKPHRGRNCQDSRNTFYKQTTVYYSRGGSAVPRGTAYTVAGPGVYQAVQPLPAPTRVQHAIIVSPNVAPIHQVIGVPQPMAQAAQNIPQLQSSMPAYGPGYGRGAIYGLQMRNW